MISCRELFECEGSLAQPLLNEVVFPWEAVAKIGEFTVGLVKLLLEQNGWKELCSGVAVAESAVISPMASIAPPCIIGEGAEIRPGAYIRGKVIVERGCVVGNSTELKNSVLMEGAKLPHYNYAGDSLIGKRAHMGAGAIASNYKLDGSMIRVGGIETGLKKFGAALGDGAEIGCNCVLNPGTVIGKCTSVYPGTVFRGVAPSLQIIKANGEMIAKTK